MTMSKMSQFEKIVYRILLREKIPFVQEKQFKDCYNGLYRFDFFLPEIQTGIECNGRQHYEFIKGFHRTKSDFTKAQERDRRKIAYCLAKDIKLYIIPYWESDNLYEIEDLFQDKFLAKTKFHNDIAFRLQKSKN